jgi:hypothetical protein
MKMTLNTSFLSLLTAHIFFWLHLPECLKGQLSRGCLKETTPHFDASGKSPLAFQFDPATPSGPTPVYYS